MRGAGAPWMVGTGSAGASLIEVLIGSFIVGIAAVGIAVMFSSGQAFIQSEGDYRTALQIAQERMEEIRTIGFGSTTACSYTLPTPAGSATITLGSPQVENPVPSRPGYRRTTSIRCMCPGDFTTQPGGATGCSSASPFSLAPFETKEFTVVVEPLEGTASQADRKAQPVTLQTVLVVH